MAPSVSTVTIATIATMVTMMIYWLIGDPMATMAPMVPLDYHHLSPSNGYMAVRIAITGIGANGDLLATFTVLQ
jgi:hypothetical protein